MKHYLINVAGLIDPQVIEGPFDTDEELLEAVKRVVASKEYDLDEEGEDALFWLDIDDDGKPEIGSFSGGFMDDARESI